jgi:hypothetical protein
MKRMLRVALATAAVAACGIVQAAGFTLTSPTIKPGARFADDQVFNGLAARARTSRPR